ncbi:MFS transporter [Streptomyces sp. WMMC500]|uniref:MFS transporter n=1 Tax=Streptomyces sp. WMMC500 TaxID=3015154 RepID=UPI00248CE047|nr:MFS transporter [Streptomyces sp. WMMC500]WBB59459.1 MFS transporter [Streptomyces sp. WMMC500]
MTTDLTPGPGASDAPGAPDPGGTGERAGPRAWAGLAVLALPTLLLALDISVLHLAVPHLAADLQPSNTQMLWIIDIYGFMIAGFLVTMGTLGDRVGRRRLLLIGAAAFGAASVAAAYAPGPEALIVARLLLGVAGATLMPSTLSLISNLFPDPRQRGMAFAIWAAMFSVGVALGPVAGGALLEHFWWGAAFLMGIPVMVLLLVAGPLLLPESRDPDAGRVDAASVALSLAAMLPVTYAIKELAHGPAVLPLVAAAVGVTAGAVFVRRQRRLASPLLDLGLFADRSFRSALLILLVGTIAVSGSYLFVTQYLQMVEGLSAFRAGLWLLPPAGVLIATSMAAPALARRFGPGPVMGAGLVSSAVGFALLSMVEPGGAGDIAVIVVAYALVNSGIGPVLALGTELVVGAAPPEKAGAASAVSETSTELGVALGVAVLGSVGTAVYRAEVGGGVPEGTPDAAADTARDTLAGAAAVAEELPGPLGAELLGAAREAFAGGLATVGVISAVLSLAVAAVAFTALRGVTGGGAEK